MREKEKGVTLIELIIVFVLIIIITGAIRINAGRYGKFLSVEREAMKVAQDIREMSDKARAIERIPSDFLEPRLPDGVNIADYEGGMYMTLYGISAVKGESKYDKIAYILERGEGYIEEKIKEKQGLVLLESVSLDQGEINSISKEDDSNLYEVDEINVVFAPSISKGRIVYYGDITTFIFISGLGYVSFPLPPGTEINFDNIDIFISSQDGGEKRPVHVKNTGLIEVN